MRTGRGSQRVRRASNRIAVPKTQFRVARLFLRWLVASRSDFSTPPYVTRRTAEYLDMRFRGLRPNITARLNEWGITIWVEWQGIIWDLIPADFDCVARRYGQGYGCNLCRPEAREIFATRERLWIKHVFESFQKWCNETLAPTQSLAFFGSESA